MYASIPATLSAMPEAATAGATAARPPHAAHVVVPSAIFAPHILQNAIEPSSYFWQTFFRQTARRGTTQRCGKIPENRVGRNRKLGKGSSVAGSRLLFSKVAQEWEFEHLALQGLYDEHNPDHEKSQAHYHRQQPDEQMAEDGNKEQREAGDAKDCSNHYGSKTHSDGLERMKAHKAVVLIRLHKKKNNRWHYEVSQSASQRFGQHSNHAMRARGRTHAATAAGTKGSGIGHCSGAAGTGDRHLFEQSVAVAPYQNLVG